MIWSFLPFWPNSIYWKRQGLVRRLDCEQFLFFFRFSKGYPLRASVSRLQSHAWLFACLMRFARRAKKKERLLEVYKTPYRDSAKSFANGRKRNNIGLNRLDVELAWNIMSDILYFRWLHCSVYNISDRPSYSWNSSALHWLENIIKTLSSFSPSAGWEKTKRKITLFPIFRSDLEPVCAWVSELR